MSEHQDEKLSAGIFWIISDSIDLSEYKFLTFKVHCDQNGNVIEEPAIPLNSKKGNCYKFRKTWNEHVINNPLHTPYNNRKYNYYLRGRVEISNNCAEIHVHPDILYNSTILHDIRKNFGLFEHSVCQIRTESVGDRYFADELREREERFQKELRQNNCEYIQRMKHVISAVLRTDNLVELKTALTTSCLAPLFYIYEVLCSDKLAESKTLTDITECFPDDLINNLLEDMTEEDYVEFKGKLLNWIIRVCL